MQLYEEDNKAMGQNRTWGWLISLLLHFKLLSWVFTGYLSGCDLQPYEIEGPFQFALVAISLAHGVSKSGEQDVNKIIFFKLGLTWTDKGERD